ncbi:MAG: cytidylate kinase family protein, partial [Acidimicrobiales bacterium]
FGARPFATGGMLAAAITFALLMLLPVDFSFGWFALLLLANGLAMGLFAAPNTAGIMNSVPPNRRGVASGMRSTFQNAGMTLSIGLFFTIMVVGLSSTLPAALMHGLTTHGVPASAASKVAGLPPVSVLFAAFLGYNPMRALLGPTLGKLSSAHRAVLTGHSFFSNMISRPFHHGLTIVFTFALVMCLVAAAASWLRGKHATAAARVAGLPAGSPALAPISLRGNAAPAVPEPPKRVVTLSASYGAAGGEVGRAVAGRLGLPFLDRAVPVRVAERLGVPVEDALEHDERVQGDIVRSLIQLVGAPVAFGPSGFETGPVDDEQAYRQATEAVLGDVAQRSGGVILGRAGAIVLRTRPDALHVRLDGPEPARVTRAMAAMAIDELTAWSQLRQADHARIAYLRHLYGADPTDRRLYDLVIDSTAVPLEACVDAIVAAATG